jgi:aryl-phospho-beta-D-glucosidase BglC (GH1 family)
MPGKRGRRQGGSVTTGNEVIVMGAKIRAYIPLAAVFFILYSGLGGLLEEAYANDASKQWGQYRGVTTQLNISESDVAHLASLGANLVRLTAAKFPLMEKQPPYKINMEHVERLDRVIGWCEKYGLQVVIDPHTFPGTKSDTTITSPDILWKDYFWHDRVAELWAFLAKRYGQRGPVIVGYDLVNEPAVPNGGKDGTPASWNDLVERLIKVIRKYDQSTYIIVEPALIRYSKIHEVSRLEGIRLLRFFDDPRVVYSPHMYWPKEVSRQGLKGWPTGIKYPGQIGGEFVDKARLSKELRHIAEFQKRYNVPIYISEFSATIWGGAGSDRYVSDLIDIFEEMGWSWTYHAYRQAAHWDAEKTPEQPNIRQKSTPRLEILKAAFSKNPSSVRLRTCM